MKQIVFILIILSNLTAASAQMYDLVVTTNGDSIACNIDSITDNSIYFEINHKGKWIHSRIKREEVAVYSYKSISRKDFYFDYDSHTIYSRHKTANANIKHDHQYFFGPTAFSMKKSDQYYSTQYALIHSYQYAFSDRFSARIGTDIFFVPFYIIATCSFPVNDKSAFAIGDLLISVPTEFTGNLLYGSYSRGDHNSNFTLSAGIWTSDIARDANNTFPAIGLAGQVKVSPNKFLVSENYFFSLNMQQYPDYDIPNDEHYYQKFDVYIGMAGIKTIGKKNPKISWQYGILGIVSVGHETIYRAYNEQGQIEQKVDDGGLEFIIPIPYIAFAYKFGRNYR